jgi:replication initiation protein RepC
MDTDHRTPTRGHRPATGLRKLTPPMLGTIKVAETYRFTAAMLPGQALAAFKAAAPYLGFRPSVVHAVDWLFRFTDPIDWQPSSRPIVWPSAAMQQQEMGLGASQVKNLNRHLVELGLVVMRDSPNGKRYGRRGPQGRIIEAYGFDLSPIASRFAEFQAVAQAGRDERARLQGLRRRATIARNGIRQLLETAVEQRITGGEWDAHHEATWSASRGVAGRRNSEEIEMAVATLERAQSEMRHFLEVALGAGRDSQTTDGGKAVDSNPKQPENWPHITTTNHLLNPKDTVIAADESNFGTASTWRPTRTIEGPTKHGFAQGIDNVKRGNSASRTDSGSLLKITPAELTRLAPRLKPYLRDASPKWPEIVEAADSLRDEMGISKSIWGDACLAMGREQAAIAVAIVSAKPPGHFRGSPGAYFHGMVSKARSGKLHLARTVWGMRGHVYGQNGDWRRSC